MQHSYADVAWRGNDNNVARREQTQSPQLCFIVRSVFLSGRVPWRASWRHWGSSRKSFTLKASAWTAPSEHTWSQLVAQPALGSGRWRHSGPGDWRSTRPCSSLEHQRAPCWRRSGLTSTLTIRCFMWRERLRWAPSPPTCHMALHRNTPNKKPARGSSQQDVSESLERWTCSGLHVEMHHFHTVRMCCKFVLSQCHLSQLNAIMLEVR